MRRRLPCGLHLARATRTQRRTSAPIRHSRQSNQASYRGERDMRPLSRIVASTMEYANGKPGDGKPKDDSYRLPRALGKTEGRNGCRGEMDLESRLLTGKRVAKQCRSASWFVDRGLVRRVQLALQIAHGREEPCRNLSPLACIRVVLHPLHRLGFTL